MNDKQKTVLFCPLDWGLGHIARDLPLIRAFHKKGYRVIVAASTTLTNWLTTEFPDVDTTLFEGPEIKYSKSRFLLPKMILSLPKLIKWPTKEKKYTAFLVKKYTPDLIISDNRYGARHPNVFSVIITHQLMLKMPLGLKWLEYPVHRIIKRLIAPFDECWIPDFGKENSLAGDLVHKYQLPENARLIGPLSRFDGRDTLKEPLGKPPKKSLLAIISGPEPQRSIFEEKILNLMPKSYEKRTLIRGIPKPIEEKTTNSDSVTINNHVPTAEMLKLIQGHSMIVARAGYSTIMDMYFLKKSICIVPTPGQNEQLYLARYHHMKRHYYIEQNNVSKIFETKTNIPINTSFQNEDEHFKESLIAQLITKNNSFINKK